uniref:Uncharacterized protein n=1 Tax=Brassica oleracea TaxID=3712 RepID=A0A3P6AH44_BRAOL|nr:unnamed protein product [Brassica oleracea]
MVCWVSGQQQTPNPIRKGDGVLVAEEAQPLADGAHPLASRACSWGKTYPLIFYKYGGPPVDFIIQFQSKILREKRRERERERESSGQGKAEFRVVRFPTTLIVCEATSDQDGGPRQRGEPRGGSEGLLGHLDPGPRPDQELRMVLVKPRSREGSVSERLCNVWLDDVRDELVIVYETVKKLCIGSHVSK